MQYDENAEKYGYEGEMTPLKCDELQQVENPIEWGLYYDKSEVDEAIAELKDKLQLDEDEMAGFLQLEEECGGGDLRNYIAELKAENERLKKCEIWMKQHFFCEEVIACESAKNRQLRRALWIARAKRAIEKIAWFKLWNASISTMNPEDGARQEFDKWKKNLGKFFKKAEEYK